MNGIIIKVIEPIIAVAAAATNLKFHVLIYMKLSLLSLRLIEKQRDYRLFLCNDHQKYDGKL